MSHQRTDQMDIMALLRQLQALERDNGRLAAENEILCTVLHAQTEQVKELLQTIQAQRIELEYHQRQASKL